MAPSVAKNTFYLTAASVGQKLLAFVYFLFVARIMQPENTGAYFLALSITTIFSVIADFGITQVVIREVAKRPEEATSLVRRALWLKIPFVLMGIVGAILTAWLLNYEPIVRELVFLAALVMTADAVSLLFYGVMRGHHALQYESLGVFIGQLITVLIGGAVLLTNPSLHLLILALIAGSTFNMLFSARHVVRLLGRDVLTPLWDGTQMRTLLLMAFPFALAGVFVKVYSYVDSVFISKLLGTEAVGIYSIAYKFTYAFQFLPMAFVAALYPRFSALVGKDAKSLAHLFDDAMWYMMLIAAPITFGVWAIAPDAILLAGEEYAQATSVLRVLIFVLIPIFLDFPIGSLLNAADRQGTKTAIMGGTMVINVVANAILIPMLGLVGAAWAAMISFWFLFLAGVAFVPQLIPGYRFRHLLRVVLPILASGFVMGAVTYLLRPAIGFIPVIGVAAGLYTVLLWASGSFTSRHMEHVQRFLRRGR